ncbi:hypothetical protein MXB_5602 [Myxobolus squamalis]|nr:hypothetical protein MXB_5602 [Myxobolus squamalis]
MKRKKLVHNQSNPQKIILYLILN